MRVFTQQCRKKKINFLKLKNNILSPASKQDRDVVDKHDLAWIGYADDIVLCLTDMRMLQRAIDEFCATFRRFGLNINEYKIKTQLTN